MNEGNWGIGYRSGDGDWWFVHQVDALTFTTAVTTREADKIKMYANKEAAEQDVKRLGSQYWVMGRDAINKMLLEQFFGGDPV